MYSKPNSKLLPMECMVGWKQWYTVSHLYRVVFYVLAFCGHVFYTCNHVDASLLLWGQQPLW